MYFLEKGLVRGYHLNNDKEITTGFMGQYDFVISPVSFYAQQPSFEYLEIQFHPALMKTLYKQRIIFGRINKSVFGLRFIGC